MARDETLIIGGGIAGLATAVRLAETGVRVTLLETRKKLGGRATSFTDVRSGEVLDNCQHVVHLKWLLEDLQSQISALL